MTTTTRGRAAQLGQLLMKNAPNDRSRAAAQALAEEETILALDNVRAAFVVKQDGRMTADWERLSSRVYTLPFDEEQRAFVGLVLSMLGIGQVPLSAVEKLDERRLIIMQRAITRLAGNDRIAVGTRV